MRDWFETALMLWIAAWAFAWAVFFYAVLIA